ncbi:DUF3536 domain-containing protein [Desulfovibrio sp. TomC]|uniref:DUF3536 domain-containing protein n=1 Tax=Desulfovibrio sp. TomC TaxID=1562888 RepID=UPI0005753CC0|nr:DUF3536 domain-containing protein [Desulfovibrio sp. TomC]KHK00532.1 Alpha-amylase/alpha-mannosidase [Desulfovibrio sp. TomC]
MERYVCIHGHFYQPPRENPWLEAIEIQDSAYPFHDWNERIAVECYATNAQSRLLDTQGRIAQLVNNYANISFNFGPTVLLWMRQFAPETYRAIVEADRLSQEKFAGHGSALAQPYNHMILPLANRRDKRTQIVWGIRDFQYRFGRAPEGMWLPETAVDLETLDIMADAGITFTILAPRQASRVRPYASEEWMDVSDGRINPGLAYRITLPSGRFMNVFFYDGPISQAVAFEGLLNNGEDFAQRLLSGFPDDSAGPTGPHLVNIATDGESYGHHHRGGEMALTRAIEYLESNGLARLTNYGQYLEEHPPIHEVMIYENSSWSCIHGIERWQSDCGCNSGSHPHWNQAWRAPLREALDWLRDAINAVFEPTAVRYLSDPWEARNAYIDVVTERSPERLAEFLSHHSIRPLRHEEEIIVLSLMELQRHAMLMYTSCGWFFDELSGIETVQVIQYAGRVLQLADQLFIGCCESEFLERLGQAKSNIAEHQDGRVIFERFVRPAMLDLVHVGAHFAISSLFGEIAEHSQVYCYSVVTEDYRIFRAGNTKLVIGRLMVFSDITHMFSTFCFGVLHLGDHNITCGIGEYQGSKRYESLINDLSEAFSKADFPKTILVLGEHFLPSTYSLTSLFSDERRKVLNLIMTPTLAEAEAAFGMLYEHHAPLIRFLNGSGTPRPQALAIAAELSLNSKIRMAFENHVLEFQTVQPLLEEIRLAGAPLDVAGLGHLLQNNIKKMAEGLSEQPEDVSRIERLNKAMALVGKLPFEVNNWIAQNICFTILNAHWPSFKELADQGNGPAQEWLQSARLLADNFFVQLPTERVS